MMYFFSLFISKKNRFSSEILETNQFPFIALITIK